MRKLMVCRNLFVPSGETKEKFYNYSFSAKMQFANFLAITGILID